MRQTQCLFTPPSWNHLEYVLISINPNKYYVYSKTKFAPFRLTYSSKDTLINSVMEIVTKCSEIMFYS